MLGCSPPRQNLAGNQYLLKMASKMRHAYTVDLQPTVGSCQNFIGMLYKGFVSMAQCFSSGRSGAPRCNWATIISSIYQLLSGCSRLHLLALSCTLKSDMEHFDDIESLVRHLFSVGFSLYISITMPLLVSTVTKTYTPSHERSPYFYTFSIHFFPHLAYHLLQSRDLEAPDQESSFPPTTVIFQALFKDAANQDGT